MSLVNTDIYLSKADKYERGRPSYPEEILKILSDNLIVYPEVIIADIGSGTGIFASLFLDYNSLVYAVEPNDEMRSIFDSKFKDKKNFVSIKGTAELTNLRNRSIEVITVAQALHWFNLDLARQEFKRIIKNGGKIVLVWNERERSDKGLGEAYEHFLLKNCQNYFYAEHSLEKLTNIVKDFFKENDYQSYIINNKQKLSLQSFLDRFESASYAPKVNDFSYTKILSELKKLYTDYQKNDYLEVSYKTYLYWGKIE